MSLYTLYYTTKQDGKPNGAVIAKYGMAMGDTCKATTIQLAVPIVGFEYLFN